MTRDTDYALAALAALDHAGIPWAILHCADGFSYDGSSDIDIVVPRNRLSAVTAVLREHAARNHGMLVQVIRHESTAIYNVLAFPSETRTTYLKIDVCSDYRRDGVVLFTAEELLAEQRVVSGLPAVGREMELAYFIAKRVLKRRWDEASIAELVAAMRAEDDSVLRALQTVAGVVSSDFEQGLRSADSAAVRSAGLNLFGPVLRQARRRHPFGWFTYLPRDVSRRIRRLVRPTGLHVVLLGPDGVGKSSVMQGVESGLAEAFRFTSVRHLRPELLPRRAKALDASEPYGRPVHRGPKAALKVLYLWLDYTLGYALHVYPDKVRSTLVLYDRYFADLLVDPERYRYGGPRWLARAAVALAPAPDIYVALDAPADVIQARKSEMPVERTQKLSDGYRELAHRWGGERIRLVSADGGAEDVASAVMAEILGVMRARTHRWKQ